MGQMDRVIQGRTGFMDRFLQDGNYMSPALSRGGAQITQQFLLEMALRGHAFKTQVGDATTQVDFGETAYDEDQPQIAVRVPQGTTVIPVRAKVLLEDAAGTDNLIALSATTNDIGNGTSSALTASPLFVNASKVFASQCTARSLYTGNATGATGLFEIDRWVEAFAAEADRAQPKFDWHLGKAIIPPILVGPATLQLHVIATGTAPQGFAEIVWVEAPTNLLVQA